MVRSETRGNPWGVRFVSHPKLDFPLAWRRVRNWARGGAIGALDEWAITADIAGYYTHIDVDVLERTLLRVGGDADVVTDLANLLRRLAIARRAWIAARRPRVFSSRQSLPAPDRRTPQSSRRPIRAVDGRLRRFRWGAISPAVVARRHGELVARIHDDDLPVGFQSDVIETIRELKAFLFKKREPCDVEAIPTLIMRAPGLTGEALSYLAAVADKDDSVPAVFETLLAEDRFLREMEMLELCSALMSLPPRTAPGLAPHLKRLVSGDSHSLVRARALLA
jgi:hypothetical protein